MRVADLKALFFVKAFRGNRDHHEHNQFNTKNAALGCKIQVMFKNGEKLMGTTQGYDKNRAGFFSSPPILTQTTNVASSS